MNAPTLPDDIRALYPFAPHFYETPEGRLHYLDEGEGPVVLLLHGNPTWSFYFRELIKILRPHFRCIAPDHLGCGLSDKPQTPAYRLRNRIDDIRGLLAHLKIDRYDLVAHDWGGAVGMGVATLAPDAVGKIVLMNTGAFLSRDIPRRIALCRAPLLGEFLVRGCNAFVRAAISMAVQTPLPAAVRRGYALPYDSWKNRIAVARFVQDIPLSPKHPSYSELQRIDAGLSALAHKPILLPWGMRDFCFTPAFLKEFQKRFPNAKTLAEPEAGHYLLEDAAATVPPAIRDFLLG